MKVKGVVHGSEDDEMRALAWHDFGITASWVMAGACGISCVIAAVGACWHHWGKKQHKKKLEELRSGDESGMFV